MIVSRTCCRSAPIWYRSARRSGSKLKAESEPLKQSRLLLCDLTARALQKCLELLGITTVERM